MSDEDFSEGSIAAANAIIGFLRQRGHGAAANDVVMAWQDGTISGDAAGDGETRGKVVDPRLAAREQGFTGDACDHCGSMRMKITGHCTTCQECGTTTGCA